MGTSRTMNWIVAVLGIWEGIAPFVLGYSSDTTALWDSIIVGLALLILGIVSATTSNPSTARTIDWVNAVIGLWLVLAAFILGFTFISAAVTNAIIVGIVVIILEVIAALAIRSTGTAAV